MIKKKTVRPNAGVNEVMPSVAFIFFDESALQGFINKFYNENMMHEVWSRRGPNSE